MTTPTLAFSTVACPELTLARVADMAARSGFSAVELRTFGDTSRRSACDPALSSEAKVREIFLKSGVRIAGLATGLRFDEPVFPPVVGYLNPRHQRFVREAKRAVDLAVALECPFVRVFGFEYPDREPKAAALKRIAGRVRDMADAADKSGVRVVIENGGSFSTAQSLRELIDHVGHPLVGACYALAAAHDVHDSIIGATAELGDRFWMARVKDLDAHGRPVPLERGVLSAEAFVRTLVAAGFGGTLVYEWDRAWFSDLAPASDVLPGASQALNSWLSAPPQSPVGRRAGAASV